MTDYRRLAKDGLWSNNMVFAQMLALCPVMAVTGTATNGLGMGLATLFVLVGANLIISMIRHTISQAIRIPVYIVIIATLVTLTDMLINAFAYELYKVLGLFIALIVVNCAILGRAEAFASKNTAWDSFVDSILMGIGLTWALVAIGGFREIIGSGTLFANADLLLGPAFGFLEITLIPDYKGFLIMILPPGGFIAVGFLLVLKRWIDQRVEQRQQRAEQLRSA
ncbi:electron transport complex subunit E [Marinospirillum alkaliphilum]|uniref:Ion-translocating oxidoreductase complex subunit E n=1 Tax=Marinospirillum alkaliphilum DSM 21637 TaxID=1122209 RepID=A0A1K1TAE8_9GAMM|nr:electron transport complex subunit E [Marinospirillum alkaliphilum]SFW97591.1 electron transport complex protein RnfE [Marinospirillum alkaliphilum DSM 21637]